MHHTFTSQLTVGEPTANGHIWEKTSVIKAIEEFNSRAPVYCEPEATTQMHDEPDIAQISHSVIGLSLVNNKIVAAVEFLDTPDGNALKRLIESGADVKTNFAADGTPHGIMYPVMNINRIKTMGFQTP